MAICANCGRESADDFRFCPHCGGALDGEPGREQRKMVTALFCDVVGSTELGESIDVEALGGILGRYFERMRAIVERHGGTVEKFIGDAVTAVFGAPVAHEDDALRAVRAASEMLAAMPELGLNLRIGINSGAVLTGVGDRLVTGDPINVAARLEQAAAPGTALIGEATLALVGAAVAVEPVGALELKGKSEPVQAFRLVSASGELSRRFATPMVGREVELARLREAFEACVRDRVCRLFTVLGVAGVGKSRLAGEFWAGIDARVVRGHCLSYGDGITYWPAVEIVRELGALPAGDAALPLRSLLGESEAVSSAEEIAWGFRKLLEEEARKRPLVCVFDDLHWAEETLLDLVEHVADFALDVPLLLLCLARPELLEKRPAWGGGRRNSTTVLLEPLDAAETDRLLDELGDADPSLRRRISAAAEGNPLFLEEMVALVRASGGREVVVPPTIQALLAARLDQLETRERGVLQRGSVEGRVFHHGAVRALGDGVSEAERLGALLRKQLVEPDAAQFADDEAYRFRHLLIRDAAYEALPKAVRAELHQRFADWLATRAAELIELDEIVGHHLEQAALFKLELGKQDPALTERAAERLAAGGRRALGRGDDSAAASLLERSLELMRPFRLHVQLEVDLAEAVRSDPAKSVSISERAAERAAASGDPAGEALARAVAARHRFELFPATIDELDDRANAALPLLEGAADHEGLLHVWNALSEVANHRGRWDARGRSLEHALRNARLAHRPTDELVRRVGGAFLLGPMPVGELLEKLDGLAPETTQPGLLLNRARLLAMLDRLPEAWPLALDAYDRARDRGTAAAFEYWLAEIATTEGDDEAAAEYMRIYCDWLELHDQRANLSTAASMLGRSLAGLGRLDEAEALAEQGRELGDRQDATTQAVWRQVRALVLAGRADHDAAARLANDAVAIIEETDGLNLRGDAYCDLARVLVAAGRVDDAAVAYEHALSRYSRKQNLAMMRRVRERIGPHG